SRTTIRLLHLSPTRSRTSRIGQSRSSGSTAGTPVCVADMHVPPYAVLHAHSPWGYAQEGTGGAATMTAENKELQIHFYNEVFIHGNVELIDSFIGEEYIQHNPLAPNGTEALRGFVTGFRARFPTLRHTVVRAIAEDDLVLLHSKAVLEPGTTQAVVDIFRL